MVRDQTRNLINDQLVVGWLGPASDRMLPGGLEGVASVDGGRSGAPAARGQGPRAPGTCARTDVM